MRRREVIAGLGATAVWPRPGARRRHHEAHSALVIGNADVPSFQKELREGLSELGRIEGRHYVIELRSANGQLSRLAELAAELVRLKVDVIVALFTPCGLAAKEATRDIPIVFLTGDPLGPGWSTAFRGRAETSPAWLRWPPSGGQMAGALPRHAAVRAPARRDDQCSGPTCLRPPPKRLRRWLSGWSCNGPVSMPRPEQTSMPSFAQLVASCKPVDASWSRPGELPDRATGSPRRAALANRAAGDLPVSCFRGELGGLMSLWRQPRRLLFRQSGIFVGQYLSGDKPVRPPGRAAHQIRADDQPQDREGTRP